MLRRGIKIGQPAPKSQSTDDHTNVGEKRMFTRLSQMLTTWRATSQTVTELSRLSDEQLRDIGISRDEIPHVVRRLQATN
jgi:uncharacterized protein YjiS (DUF1127 family)